MYFTMYLLSLIGLALAGYCVGDHYGFSRAALTASKQPLKFATDVGYLDLPRMNLTLASSDTGKTGKVRIDLSLEIDKRDIERIRDFQPRVTDKIISFVRNQDIEALRQPYNQRVFHEELLKEVNKVVMPVPVMNVVLREMIFL